MFYITLVLTLSVALDNKMERYEVETYGDLLAFNIRNFIWPFAILPIICFIPFVNIIVALVTLVRINNYDWDYNEKFLRYGLLYGPIADLLNKPIKKK